MWLRLASLPLLALALAAQPPADSAPPSPRVARAERLTGRIVVDGRLDEADWQRPAPATGFRQRQPVEGAPATQRSVVRVLHDDEAVYVGAWLYDTHPDSILSMLARRDESTPADEFYAQFDSFRDRRTAFVFSITPGGVRSDLMIHDGNQIDGSWDAVWKGATSRDAAGWYVEYRIPFSQLRFSMPADGELAWGVNFLRWIGRHREDSQWSLIPQTAPAWVPHYGELRGIRLRGAPRRVELQPYSLARATRGALPGAAARAAPAALGADLRLGVTSSLTVTATANPDFGQVEADPSEVNLTAFETFLAERRPFFVEGANLFRYGTGEWYDQGELFYSRRIGRAPQGALPPTAAAAPLPAAATILGAVKLSGRTASGWSVGVLDAVTAAEHARWTPADGAGNPRRLVVEPRTNYAVARVMRDLRGGESALGAVATTVHRALGDAPAVATLRSSALVTGVDGRHRFGRARFEVTGWATGSLVRGSAAAIDATQRSSTHLFQRPDAALGDGAYDPTRTSLAGAAMGVRAAKVAGNWRAQATLRGFSPGFEINDVGFQPRADRIIQYLNLGYEHPAAGKRVRSWWAYANHWRYRDWRGTPLTRRVQLDGQVELNGGWRARLTLIPDAPGLRTDVLRGGPALAIPGRTEVRAELATDGRRPLSLSLRGRALREGEGAGHAAGAAPAVTWRPSTRARLTVEPDVSTLRTAWQYVATADARAAPVYVVGELRQRTTLLTTRASYVFAPDVSLQLHAQPFLSAGRYAAFREVAAPRARTLDARLRRWDAAAVRLDDGRYTVDRDGDGAADLSFANPDFGRRELNANAVLRWEYRPGSTFFVVWSHGRRADDADGSFDLDRDARRLFRDPAANVLVAKLTYWFGR